ncbi:MAG: sigma-70 family RNA polymerase sigma factor [Verrucomicrobiae bacterium]|nr:sigma-70 family RNA polymerase sigma factor [Verrucomicrobiae bacterium]
MSGTSALGSGAWNGPAGILASLGRESPANDSQRTSYTLIRRAKDIEDTDGWREFFRRYRRLVMSIARRYGLEKAEAEEVVQEVFLRVAKNIGVFEPNGRVGAFRRWLGKLTYWCALDARRQRSPFDAFDSGKTWDAVQEVAEQVPTSCASTPDQEAMDRDFQELLLRRLKQLVSPKDFRIFWMITFEGCTHVQVAEAVGMHRNAVDTILCRVRKVARRELERLGERP